MGKVIYLKARPSVDETEWSRYEAQICSSDFASDFGLSEEDQKYLVKRMKAIFEKLPRPKMEFPVEMTGLDHLSSEDQQAVVRSAQSIAEEIVKTLHSATGILLSEILFFLIEIVWARGADKAPPTRVS